MNPSDPNQNVNGDTSAPPAPGQTFAANTPVTQAPAVAPAPEPAQPVTQPAQPVQQPTTGVAATTAQTAQTGTPATPAPAAKKSKKLIIIGLAIAGIVIVAGGAYAFTRTKDAPVSEEAAPGDATTDAAAPADTASTLPAGWVTRERKCFTLALPEKNDLSTDDNGCLTSVRFGEHNQLMSIFAFNNNSTSLDAEVAQWKDDQKGIPMTIVSETAEKSGDYDAKRIIYKSPPSSADQSIIYFVHTKDAYKVENTIVNGFVFRSAYTSSYYSEYTENINNVIKNIQWK